MSRLLFENSKVALGFAGVTIAGAAIFAVASGSLGTSGRSGMDGGATVVASAQPAAPAPKAAPASPPANQPEIADFAPDEELIDDASGIDPNPGESFELASNEPGGGGEAATDEDETGASDGPPSGPAPRARAASGKAAPPLRPPSAPIKRSYNKSGQPKGIVSTNVKPVSGGQPVRPNAAF